MFVVVIVCTLLVLVAVALGWRELRPPPVPIAVLSAEWSTRRRWRRALADGLRRLLRLVRRPEGTGLALVVVEALPGGQRATTRPGSAAARTTTPQLICLALSTGERPLSPDEVLAALAEQYLALLPVAKARGARPAAAAIPPTGDQLGALLTDLGISGNGTPKHP